MYRFLISIFAAAACFFAGQAANVARVTVNGEPVAKVVTAITFDGDQMRIHFGDSDSMDADMGDVLLAFAEDGMSAIDAANLSAFSYDGIVGDLLTVSGLAENTILSVFDVSGKTLFGPVAAEGRMEINVAAFPAGVYMLRAGNEIVKFTKR